MEERIQSADPEQCDSTDMKRRSIWKPTWRRITWLAAWVFAGVFVLILGAEWGVRAAAQRRCFASASACPERPTALVLGCAPKLRDGRDNLFFQPRITAAAALYHQNRVEVLIVSGDNHHPEYDEPTAMKAALIDAGVPEDRIYCDYAGFRTLDSVQRAREVFGQKQITIVSQPFHNERALYLAQHFGMDAVAFNATDVPRRTAPRTWLRERLARVQAVLDTQLLGTRSKFLGDPVTLKFPPRN